MVITCEYCGSGITLGNQGWTGIQKQTMLALKIASVDELNSLIKPLMDKGLLNRHLQENSKQEETSLSYVPYWIVSVSARAPSSAWLCSWRSSPVSGTRWPPRLHRSR
jgi:hypothetical protein